MNDFSENPEYADETPDEEFVPDPSVLADLDQQGAAFADAKDQFVAMYGFEHDCRCAQDYAEGKLGQVTECYLGMVDDALATCVRLNWENGQLKGMVEHLINMNNDLIAQLETVTNFDADDFIEKALAESIEEDTDGSGSEA